MCPSTVFIGVYLQRAGFHRVYIDIMAEHNQTGVDGEVLAAEYLVRNGFTVLHRNWRWGHLEVDIIACRKEKLHFVEVKTRRSTFFGYPEEGVSKKKFKLLMRSADQYLHLNKQWKRIEFDILSIMLVPGKEPEYFFIEDVHL